MFHMPTTNFQSLAVRDQKSSGEFESWVEGKAKRELQLCISYFRLPAILNLAISKGKDCWHTFFLPSVYMFEKYARDEVIYH